MSGSSLDGSDFALIELDQTDAKRIGYRMIQTCTIAYSEKWASILRNITQASAKRLLTTHHEYSVEIARMIQEHFNIHEIDYIAFHGHTVFHYPGEGFTFQLGHGGTLSALTKCPVVCDFRSTDIALSGQGTPLAPLVDRTFFQEYSHVLNLGGIVNISIQNRNSVKGWDIAPCNQWLNYYAEKAGYKYDAGGNMAREGHFIPKFAEALLSDPFFEKKPPKSLDNSTLQTKLIEIDHRFKPKPADALHTCVQIIAKAIGAAIHVKNTSILITGGGAKNTFLIESIKAQLKTIQVSIPSEEMIDYKECLLMCLCAYFRVQNKHNNLQSVTGAKFDSVGGAIYQAYE